MACEVEDQVRLLQSDLSKPVIARKPFGRLVKDVVNQIVSEKRNCLGPGSEDGDVPDYRVSSHALAIVQEATEALGMQTMVAASLLAGHARRKTVKEQDVQLYLKVQNVKCHQVCVPTECVAPSSGSSRKRKSASGSQTTAKSKCTKQR